MGCYCACLSAVDAEVRGFFDSSYLVLRAGHCAWRCLVRVWDGHFQVIAWHKCDPSTLPHTKRTYHPNLTLTRRIVVPILVLMLATNAPASASIFDPLLRILLPFYQGDKDHSPVSDSPSEPYMDVVAPVAEPVAPAPALIVADSKAIVPSSFKPSTQPVTPSASADPALFTLLQAEFAADRGDVSSALSLYKNEAFKKNAAAVFERALGLSLQHETPAESLAFAKAWQAQNPNHIPAIFYVAHLGLRAQDYDTAAIALNQILTHDAHADLSQILTGIFPNTQASQQALFNALRTIDSDQNVSLSVLKAGLLIQMDEIDAARLHVDNALRLNPDNLAILTLKADILRYSDDDGSLTALSEFLADVRKHVSPATQKELYLYEIRIHIDHNELYKAWALLKDASKQFASDHELTLLASLVALDIRAYSEANALLTKLITDPSYAAHAHYYLGISHERTQQHALAAHHYRQVTHGEFIMDATKKLVAYELMAGHVDSAIITLEALRQSHPSYAGESLLIQADILVRQGKQSTAIALLRQAVNDDPQNGALLYGLTSLLDDSEHDKGTLLASLVELDPMNAVYQLAKVRHALALDIDDYAALTQAQLLADNTEHYTGFNTQIRQASLKLLAEHALHHHNYHAVVNYLKDDYQTDPDLNLGILLLRAYQGMGDEMAMGQMLQDLQRRFGGEDTDDVSELLHSTPADSTDTQPTPSVPQIPSALVGQPSPIAQPLSSQLDEIAKLNYEHLPTDSSTSIADKSAEPSAQQTADTASEYAATPAQHSPLQPTP